MGLSRFSSSVTVRTQAERQMLLLKNIDRTHPFRLFPFASRGKGFNVGDHDANDRQKNVKLDEEILAGRRTTQFALLAGEKRERRLGPPFFLVLLCLSFIYGTLVKQFPVCYTPFQGPSLSFIRSTFRPFLVVEEHQRNCDVLFYSVLALLSTFAFIISNMNLF